MGWRGPYKLWLRCDVCGGLYDVGAVVRKVYVGVVVHVRGVVACLSRVCCVCVCWVQCCLLRVWGVRAVRKSTVTE